MAHEADVKGVKVKETGNKQWAKNYSIGDVQHVYRQGNFNSWSDIIHWLEQNGDADNELTPGETVAMKVDMSKLKQQGKPFTTDPNKAYHMACGERS